MPRLIPFRLAAACALALALLLSGSAVAVAKGPLVDLRVVSPAGKTLAEKRASAAAISVATSPRATCFGPGSGGSGEPAPVRGRTALAALAHGAKSNAALRPLLISDSFDFGLAVCGIGGFVAKGKASWYLKVNHETPKVGSDAAAVKAGDEVLWYLTSSFPYPDELVLRAPDRAEPGQPFSVRVFAYDEAGKRKPAAGVAVSGAAAPTGGDGRTTVVLRRPARLIARRGEDIPSNREVVCLGGRCPGGRGR